MTDERALRRILRESDPAADAEMSPTERARMRAVVTGAAGPRAVGWPAAAALRFGATCLAVVVVAFVARHVLSPAPQPIAASQTPVVTHAPPLAAPPAVAVPVPRVLPARHAPARHRNHRDEGGSKTRIVFTAPEGTRILWFGAVTAAKEDAS